MAGLLHDVGHGPFGHFFDDHYLDQFGITHEDIGSHVIEHELGDLLRHVRRNPRGQLQPLEELEPKQIAWLIRRPTAGRRGGGAARLAAQAAGPVQRDLHVDNMDFVLRDAYMSGYNTRAFDLWRLLHYTFFTDSGLTIHSRGLPTLITFIETRANLFRTIYFHRTVRALDLSLEEVFPATMRQLFPGNPLEHLDAYRTFTESSFLVDVGRWETSTEPELRELGDRWAAILSRNVSWKMATERTINFHTGAAERTTIYSEPQLLEQRMRGLLPRELREIPLRVDVARHYHRPSGRRPAGGQNFLLNPTDGSVQELNDDELFRALPTSFAIFRVYSRDHRHDAAIVQALEWPVGRRGGYEDEYVKRESDLEPRNSVGQLAVLAAVKEQRFFVVVVHVAGHDFAEENFVIAAGQHVFDAAVDPADGVDENRAAGDSRLRVEIGEVARTGTREAGRKIALVGGQDAHREDAARFEIAVGRRVADDGDQNQRRVERQRRDGVGRHAPGFVAGQRADHGDTGGKVSENPPLFLGIKRHRWCSSRESSRRDRSIMCTERERSMTARATSVATASRRVAPPVAAPQHDRHLELVAVADDSQLDRVARMFAFDRRQEVVGIFDRLRRRRPRSGRRRKNRSSPTRSGRGVF